MILPRKPLKLWLVWAVLVLVLTYLAARHLDLNGADLNDAFGAALRYLGRFFPPDYRAGMHYGGYLLETVAMAAWGTAIGFMFAALSTLGSARNLTPNPSIYYLTRAAMSIARVLPFSVVAIIFVGAFGPGPLAGVCTVSMSAFGVLSKMWSESLERVDQRVFEGIAASGGHGFQLLRFGGWPSVSREIWGFSLFTFDLALREAAVIGIFGAGGIGMELSTSLRLFEYQRAAIIVLMIVGIVLGTDLMSAGIRKRLS